MKCKRSFNLVLTICLGLCACSQQKKQESSGNQLTNKLNDAVAKTGSNTPSGEGKKLVATYQQQLPALLTKQMAAAVSGFPIAEAKEEYSKVLKDLTTHHIQYSWKNGRTGKLRGFKGEYPVSDVIKLSWLKTTTLEAFKKNYHTPTEDELKKMNEKINENTRNDKTGNMAKDMAKGFANGLSFEDISDVGEYAVWNNKYKELCVYYQGLQFLLFVDVGPDEQVNKQKSIALANQIISKKTSTLNQLRMPALTD